MCNNVYLSVVLAVYNNEQHVKVAIESVLNQTYPYFELIIVNDGSTDRSSDIIKNFSDERIKYIEKKNTGLADSLNIGIKASKYSWIVRMDGDDICLPDRFKYLVQRISDDIDVIGSNAIFFKNSKRLFISNMPLSHQQILDALHKGKTGFIHPTVMIRKSLLEKVEGYDINFKKGQDLNLWIRCIKISKGYVNIESPLLYYRVYEKQKSSEYERIVNDYITKCIFLLSRVKPLNEKEYNELRSLVINIIPFKISIYLSKFRYMPLLNYLTKIWDHLRIGNGSIKNVTEKFLCNFPSSHTEH